MRKTFRKTFKRNNKAGNRFLERKVHVASIFNGAQRDVTNMILRDYAASRIQKSRRTMVSKKDFENEFETRVPNFYNNLIRFIIVLRRTNPDINTVSAIKDDILRTIPDRTVAGLLRLPNLNEEINLLRNLLTNHFPPSNEKEIAELIEVADSIIRALNIPLHARITVPLLPYRQHGFVRRQTQRHSLAEGRKRKRKSRHAKRRN
jgi:hypothetical protein